FEPYNSCIPSTSSCASSNFRTPDDIIGNMIASSKDERPRPSKCLIPWTTTDSRSIPDEDEDVVMWFISHVSSKSRCSDIC
nr:hypothetical protein [Tanacetum cinerariifolium]